MDQPTEPPIVATDVTPAVGEPPATPTGPSAHKPVASYIHTLVVVLIMAGVSFMSAKAMEARQQANPDGPFAQYLTTLAWLWLLALLCYVGIRARKFTLNDVIGGRWKSFDDFLIDIAIAGGFWLASAICLAGIKLALDHGKVTTLGNLPEAAKNIAPLIPHTPREIVLWILLSITAGLCEEFVFRGYLQRQFTALTRNAAAGIVLAAIVFGMGHLYQGVQQMIVIGLYGAMFGTLAFFRKSLRPGMMAHAWQDTLSGLALSVLLPHAGK
jgi:membrane protease YdiL (CAAX protease family)